MQRNPLRSKSKGRTPGVLHWESDPRGPLADFIEASDFDLRGKRPFSPERSVHCAPFCTIKMSISDIPLIRYENDTPFQMAFRLVKYGHFMNPGEHLFQGRPKSKGDLFFNPAAQPFIIIYPSVPRGRRATPPAPGALIPVLK